MYIFVLLFEEGFWYHMKRLIWITPKIEWSLQSYEHYAMCLQHCGEVCDVISYVLVVIKDCS